MSLRSESICPLPAPVGQRPPFKLARTYRLKYHGSTMGSARSSFPVRVGTMLTAAVPALGERLLAERIRQSWRGAVGAELAHRTRPGELRAGTLTVMADNPPWLQELSMRSAEVLQAVRARFGPTVTTLRLSLAGPAPAPERPKSRRAAPAAPLRLDADELALVEDAAAPVRDEALASTVRRIMAKGLIARRGGAVPRLLFRAGTLAGCATAQTSEGEPVGPKSITIVPPGRRAVGVQGEAYDHYVIAQMEARAGRLPQAIGQLREAIKFDPNTAVLWIQLSQWLIRINDTAGAFTAAQKAIALEPDNAGAHMTLADLYKRQRKTAEAEAELERAVALDPQTPDGYLALAQLHFEGKSYDKARAVLRRLVTARPNLSQGYYLLGRIGIENEQWDEALTNLKRAVDLDPDHDGAWSALGFVYEAQNKLDDAVAVYKEALKANPDNAAFVERLGDLLVKLGRYGEAQSEIESLVDSLPRDPRVWLKLGAIHYEQKQYDKAISAFRPAVALEPGNMPTC